MRQPDLNQSIIPDGPAATCAREGCHEAPAWEGAVFCGKACVEMAAACGQVFVRSVPIHGKNPEPAAPAPSEDDTPLANHLPTVLRLLKERLRYLASSEDVVECKAEGLLEGAYESIRSAADLLGER